MIALYLPKLEDLWFREKMLSDPDTMAYNAAWGGTIPFPPEAWEDWYGRWILRRGGNERFYRYLLEEESGAFVGETAYHWDSGKGVYLADVIVYSPDRGRGYGKQGLALLCQAAKENGCAELYDDIARGNPSVHMFLEMGFTVDSVTEDAVMVRKVL